MQVFAEWITFERTSNRAIVPLLILPAKVAPLLILPAKASSSFLLSLRMLSAGIAMEKVMRMVFAGIALEKEKTNKDCVFLLLVGHFFVCLFVMEYIGVNSHGCS
ncbi:hypothetical protein L1049_015921 [Liquidambar formosana]|uniref:Uncharacterized protein n=1 Tax=Liquidambar formosana TaxID=63359 RepID=A0AAP0X6W6_LIQFO